MIGISLGSVSANVLNPVTSCFSLRRARLARRRAPPARFARLELARNVERSRPAELEKTLRTDPERFGVVGCQVPHDGSRHALDVFIKTSAQKKCARAVCLVYSDMNHECFPCLRTPTASRLSFTKNRT